MFDDVPGVLFFAAGPVQAGEITSEAALEKPVLGAVAAPCFIRA